MVYDFPHPDVRLTKTALFGLSHLEVVSTNFTDRLKDCAEYNAVIMIGNATKNEDVKYWLEKIKSGVFWVKVLEDFVQYTIYHFIPIA